MQRYFVYLAYDGTAYHGWQVQPNATSVQQVFSEALSLLLRYPTDIVGAGRTDAGVHARLMVAHFDDPRPEEIQHESPLQPSFLATKLNRVLPPDISVYGIFPVKAQAHARFDATARTYHYFLSTAKDAFARHYACRMYGALDFSAMNEAADILRTVSDFTSFSKLHTDTKTNLCRVAEARWTPVSDTLWRFEITADRFLRNMVRAIVGTLVEVGRGKMSVEGFRQVISEKNRCAAGESMPANALFLVDVRYPDSVFIGENLPRFSVDTPCLIP